MKLGALFIALSSFLSALDPQGCGAGAGANTANGPGGTGTTADGGSEGTGGTNGTITTMSCGALGAHFFCDDFGGAALPGAFDDQASSAGTLALDDAQVVSAPRALLAKTLHVTTGTRTFARLEKKFAQRGSRFTLSYAQWVDPTCVGPNDGVETGMLGLHGNTYWLGIRYGNPDAIVESTLAGGLYVQGHQLRTQMKRGEWVHVSLDVDLGRKVMDLSVEGAVVVEDEPLRYPPDAIEAPNIAVGTLTDNLAFDPSACEARIDDVTLDLAR